MRLFTVLTIIRDILLCAFLGAGLAFVAANWLSGCGESYVDAQGVRHLVECSLSGDIKEREVKR